MFHKIARPSFGSIFTSSSSSPQHDPQTRTSAARLILLPTSGGGGAAPSQPASSRLLELLAISAHRCSSFFAEAAVLVLVLAVLDRFMAKGHVGVVWVLTALAISLLLLGASIATDYTAKRWLQTH